MELREHKKLIYGVSYFADSCDRDAGAQVLNQNYENVFLCILTLFASDCSKFCAGNV